MFQKWAKISSVWVQWHWYGGSSVVNFGISMMIFVWCFSISTSKQFILSCYIIFILCMMAGCSCWLKLSEQKGNVIFDAIDSIRKKSKWPNTDAIVVYVTRNTTNIKEIDYFHACWLRNIDQQKD